MWYTMPPLKKKSANVCVCVCVCLCVVVLAKSSNKTWPDVNPSHRTHLWMKSSSEMEVMLGVDVRSRERSQLYIHQAGGGRVRHVLT